MGDETRELTNTFSLARACGLFLLCAVIASPHSCLRPLPLAGVLFLGYFCLIATTALFHTVWRVPNWFWTASTMLQLAGMFVIAASLFMDQRLVRHALVALALAGGMASAVQMWGVGTRSFADGMHPDMERSAFGSMDPNFLAVDFGYCFLAALAVSAGLVVASRLIRILSLLALAPLAGALSPDISQAGRIFSQRRPFGSIVAGAS